MNKLNLKRYLMSDNSLGIDFDDENRVAVCQFGILATQSEPLSIEDWRDEGLKTKSAAFAFENLCDFIIEIERIIGEVNEKIEINNIVENQNKVIH